MQMGSPFLRREHLSCRWSQAMSRVQATACSKIHTGCTVIVCVFCGDKIDPQNRSVYRLVSGWERNRDGGGLNALALREPQDHWACHVCIDRKKRGVHVAQGSLL